MRYLILPLFLLLVSCSSTLPSIKSYKLDVQQGNVVTPKMMLQLKPAMTKSQVRFVLGTPLLTDTFHRDRWDYFYEMTRGGQVVERRRVILEFENEALKSVRGDIIPAGQPGAENAPVASIKEIRTARSNKELMLEGSNKPWWERFKFWGEEDQLTNLPEQKVDASKAQGGVALATVKASAEQATSTATAAGQLPTSSKKASKKEKATKPEPVVTEEAQVSAQLQRWNAAWQGRKLNDYLNLYSAKFVPDGMTRKAWLELQQQKFGSAEYVENIKIENIQVEVHGSIAIAQFDQISTTATGFKRVVKEIGFENEDGLWRIVSETLKTDFAPQDLQQIAPTGNQEGVILHERSDIPPEYPSDSAKHQEVQKETVKPVENGKVIPAKQQTSDKNQLPEIKPRKDEPMPAEDEPSYFEKLLEKIGF